AEVVPQSERDGGKFNAAASRAAILHGVVTLVICDVHDGSPPQKWIGNYSTGSVVFFVSNRSSIPAQTLQQLAVRLDHLVEAADVGVHVGAGSYDFGQMFLHVSAEPFPIGSGAAQRGQKMKVGVFGGETFKLFAIVSVLLAARAEQQPELASKMTFALRQQPVQHGAERRDPGSSGNEHSVAQGRAQNEIAERSLKRNRRAFVETAEI